MADISSLLIQVGVDLNQLVDIPSFPSNEGADHLSFLWRTVALFPFSRGVQADHSADIPFFPSEAALIIRPFFGGAPFFHKGGTCGSSVLPLADLSYFLRGVGVDHSTELFSCPSGEGADHLSFLQRISLLFQWEDARIIYPPFCGFFFISESSTR